MSSVTSCFFFFIDTVTPQIYTLSLHDALPIFCYTSHSILRGWVDRHWLAMNIASLEFTAEGQYSRSEEHTSELQSLTNLVCRLLLEKKNCKRTSEPPKASGSRPRSTTSVPGLP